jgi:regulator of sigma E protease
MILTVLKFLFICLEVLAIFNLLIIVHELGHFLAARWRGLYVEGFGIWFGKPVWKKKINGVTYSLGSIPAGGFVKLPQMAPMESLEGETEIPLDQLKPISALDKIIVAFAGPLFSFLLAIVFAVIVWGVGRPVSESEATTVIGYVLPDSPAGKAGLKAGDKILEVDGKPVTRFGGMSDDSVTWRIVRSEGATIPIKVERDGKTLDFSATPSIPKTNFWNRKGLRQIQILPAETPMVARVLPDSVGAASGLEPNDLLVGINSHKIYSSLDLADYAKDHPAEPLFFDVQRGGQTIKLPYNPRGATIGDVIKDSPAAAGGVKAGDRIVSINGQPVRLFSEVSDYIQGHPGQALKLGLQRDGASLELSVTPEVPVGGDHPRIGIVWGDSDGIVFDNFGAFHVIHPTPVEQIRAGVMSIVNTVGALFAPKSNVSVQHLGGPLMMMRIYYMMFENPEGWRLALWFSVVLNVNLALLNLLPIPVLDGGHITFALIEAATRRPVNHRVLEIFNTGAALVVIGFMLFISFFDAQDFFNGKGLTPKFKARAAAEEKK